MLGTSSLLAEVSHFSSHFCIIERLHGLLETSASREGTGYFLEIAKINSSQKNQCVLVLKISFRKT